MSSQYTHISSDIFYGTISLFLMLLYLGVVGYDKPWKSISIAICILIPIFIIFGITTYILLFVNTNTSENTTESKTYKEKLSENINHLKIIASLTIIYIYSRYINNNVPIYGEGKIYNPYSVFNIGKEYYNDQTPNNIFGRIALQLYRFIVISNSAILYAVSPFEILRTFYYLLFSKHRKIYDYSTIISFELIFSRLIIKSLVGYAIPNQALKEEYPDSKLLQFLQYRVSSKGFLDTLIGLVRRFVIFGIDVGKMDQIYKGDYYNYLNNFNKNIRDLIVYIIPNLDGSKSLSYILNWLQFVVESSLLRLFIVLPYWIAPFFLFISIIVVIIVLLL